MRQGYVYKSTPIEITQERILKYAILSKDFNPVHVDEDFAQGTIFGGTIAHGMLSLNLIWTALLEMFKEQNRNHLQLDVRFIKPVKKGEKIHAKCEVTEVTEAETDEFSPKSLREYKVKVACMNEEGSEFISGEAKMIN